jgi:hypothetical protein
VLSILANSRVTWPAVVRELYRIMSAFNLNIEIVAPEVGGSDSTGVAQTGVDKTIRRSA